VNKVGSGKFSNLSFNVSHHGQYVVLVTDPVSPVGVDITGSSTSYDEPPEEYFKNFTSYFTLFEWNTIRSAGPEAGALYDQFHRYQNLCTLCHLEQRMYVALKRICVHLLIVSHARYFHAKKVRLARRKYYNKRRSTEPCNS
jgi:hypothetical protein